MEAFPLDENLWIIKVHNGTTGPITDLAVDAYVVDAHGNRTDDECVPAKDRISIAEIFQKILTQAMPGVVGAITQRASLSPMAGMLPPGSLEALQGYAGGLPPQMASTISPQMNQYQAMMMTAAFPAVLAGNQPAQVVFLTTGEGQVQADIRFADEDGNYWIRPFGQLPRPAE
ncbi:hypothetical protein [Nocardia fusca]|uniref:hypothetical protein n=1 Tax=Nocardia fusca TaxID=941183 RepID=UPI0007A757CC|nr:hypothetical protein [Nocardia fusca]